jgi:hypothetical protein
MRHHDPVGEASPSGTADELGWPDPTSRPIARGPKSNIRLFPPRVHSNTNKLWSL